MTLKRVVEVSRTVAAKIRSRQNNGTMTLYFDNDGYTCFDTEEYDNWKSKKVGRKPKRKE